ncbi:7,8-dihydro-8-oxoguanine triphosphatase [Dictyobacter vulcani]|uniref:7,8-dihydro-8-oxoguanine triphosphatase n=1 Tax=Dictyobacter vulcani TaxID=2607529 RepID=A0A5J4KUS3_9CHLR|nr:8-oxo-dGTP diphosphatase [Dictyobacter vulcani]GER90217.1 7,8-dihydro-8-oxoguanine triphosphatase [Dictyobacter vulcani]
MAATIATLGYILSPDGSQILMIHRNKRPDDIHYGKYNGLGGKLIPTEDIASCMQREIQEESGLLVDHMTLRGTIFWPGFGKHGEDWFGFIFIIDRWHGEAHSGNEEGTLEWVERSAIPTLPVWPSDHQFLPMVFDDDPRPFHGVMPGAMVRWSVGVMCARRHSTSDCRPPIFSSLPLLPGSPTHR